MVFIRKATLKDLDTLVQFRLNAVCETSGLEPASVEDERPVIRNYIEQALRNGSCAIWVAEVQGCVVGESTLLACMPAHTGSRKAWDGMPSYLFNCYLLPAFRDAGTERALHELSKQFANGHREASAIPQGGGALTPVDRVGISGLFADSVI